jgi:transposase-like protein
MPRPRKPDSPFRCFNSSPEVIRLVVMMYVRFPLSLRNVEDLLFERGIDLCHETVRSWWNRFGPMFAGDIRRQRVSRNSHLPFRRRERAMLRFRQMKSLQKFASVHANFHNHFNQERHLVSRQEYKTRRSAALAEWQILAS